MMTINLPKDWTEVSVEQYQALQFIVDEDDIYVKNISIIAIMSGIETSKLEKVSLKSYTKLMNSLDFLNSPIENKLTRKFKLSGKKYKMVTDLYELNGGQYITLMHLLKNEDDTVRNLHQLMAVFCTPFKKKFLWFGKYEYEGDNHQEVSRGETNKEDNEDRRVSTFQSKYGWLNLINNLSNNDATKWDYFFELPLREFLNLISFQKAKQANDYQEQKRNGI